MDGKISYIFQTEGQNFFLCSKSTKQKRKKENLVRLVKNDCAPKKKKTIEFLSRLSRFARALFRVPVLVPGFVSFLPLSVIPPPVPPHTQSPPSLALNPSSTEWASTG